MKTQPWLLVALQAHPADHPSIGIILCKAKNQVLVEYALRDTSKPMGVAEFRLLEQLPEQLKGSLPTIEELEGELTKRDPDEKKKVNG